MVYPQHCKEAKAAQMVLTSGIQASLPHSGYKPLLFGKRVDPGHRILDPSFVLKTSESYETNHLAFSYSRTYS